MPVIPSFISKEMKLSNPRGHTIDGDEKVFLNDILDALDTRRDEWIAYTKRDEGSTSEQLKKMQFALEMEENIKVATMDDCIYISMTDEDGTNRCSLHVWGYKEEDED